MEVIAVVQVINSLNHTYTLYEIFVLPHLQLPISYFNLVLR